MLNDTLLTRPVPPLQAHPWPAMAPFHTMPPDLQALLPLAPAAQRHLVATLRQEPDRYGRLLHDSLAIYYGYRYGYQDSPCYRRTDVALEAQLLQTGLVLEDELFTHALAPAPIPLGLSQAEAAAYLHELAQDNPGVRHPVFPYLATAASRTALETTLLLETLRNEVVDDEVALLLVGLQGIMKAVVASNMWDVCGYAKLSGFHTYWLRRLLDRLQAWERLVTCRQQVPWHTRILSNTLNGLLWRSAYIFQKYGCFLITESWVAPHFQALLAGLDRVGLHHQDITVYFEAHCTIGPVHGAELVEGFAQQQPALPQHDIDAVLRGAHLAIAAGVMQWDLLLTYLSHLA